MKQSNIILLMLIICHIGHAQNLNKNLLIHYKFDGNAKDFSGNDYHGVPIKTESVIDRLGNRNSAYQFDGTSYIDLPYDKKLQPQMPVSFAFWFKLDNYNSPLIAFFDSDFSIDKYAGFYSSIVITGKKIGMGFGDTGRIGRNSRRSRRGSTLIEIGVWYHVVLVYKAVDNMDLYLNGCPDGDNYTGNGDTKVKYLGNHGTIGRVDANATAGPIYHFEGSMDEFYMWDRALTQEDVTELYFGKPATVLDLGGDKTLCVGRDYPISITKKFDTVLWSTGDTTNTIIIKKPGTYTVKAFKKSCHCFRDTIVFKGSKCLQGGCGCR